MKHVALVLMFGITVLSAASQTSVQNLRFEVASIKPVQFPPGVIVSRIPSPATIRVSGNRVSLRGSVTNLVLASLQRPTEN
jgi:beta-lactam-binding protein with PASTA domain